MVKSGDAVGVFQWVRDCLPICLDALYDTYRMIFCLQTGALLYHCMDISLSLISREDLFGDVWTSEANKLRKAGSERMVGLIHRCEVQSEPDDMSNCRYTAIEAVYPQRQSLIASIHYTKITDPLQLLFHRSPVSTNLSQPVCFLQGDLAAPNARRYHTDWKTGSFLTEKTRLSAKNYSHLTFW